ncbi:hypothetical protein OWR29_26290 [Actinoplanes sp. Pm04-4]|uniref:ARB-07466-like C-terminal domain-containing protein n=1 Tax=Paractinoplanes pyxinae TaxID=2997416 RepID=A0ABT4B663_9ACTN|nr:hypothetical protein [Actinoplanes pyxinae]MCY1141522.1 hypothetical protein [Actinoplanes pyxinae]
MTARGAAGIAVAVIGILLACAALISLPGAGTATTSCLTASGTTPDEEAHSGPGPVGIWSADQIANAAVIVTVGQRMQFPARGWVIAVAAAMQESSLINTPSGDRDSVGLFQQRPSQGWGTPEQLRDPHYAASRFYTKLLTTPGWHSMPLARAAQHVQRSGYPQAYAKWEPDAVRVIAAVTAAHHRCAALAIAAAPAARNPDGSWPQQQCSIRPDPTTGAGCITPRLYHLVQQAAAAGFPPPGCYRVDDHGEHPTGQACDWMMTGGREASGLQKAHGDAMAAWVVANADRLGIRYVIWFRMIWTPDDGWHPYNNPYGGNDPSGWHTNHVHISVR